MISPSTPHSLVEGCGVFSAYLLRARMRTPSTISTSPATATTGPITAQIVTPLITLPPTRSRPCAVHSTPSTTPSAPRVSHGQPFIGAPSPAAMDLRPDQLVVHGRDGLVSLGAQGCE